MNTAPREPERENTMKEILIVVVAMFVALSIVRNPDPILDPLDRWSIRTTGHVFEF